ncbi:MAG: hypothetical protein A2Y38_20230 [Spirochaetes bacterium GWB1_59_5]|nr:MAG: hypothetical protein A2Y38_20230 [Spirochaetes bacterium GWB1_59_5]
MSLSNFYVYHRHGFGLRKAFRFAFGITLRDFMLDLAFYVAIMALLFGLVHVALNAIVEAQAIETRRHAAYTKSLEQVVANCLSDSTGKPVQVGDEMFLCGIVSTGAKL